MDENFSSHSGRDKKVTTFNQLEDYRVSKRKKGVNFSSLEKRGAPVFKEIKERHPFQEFLYALRKEGVPVSTSEWLDLQRVLAEGKVQSLDDLYIIARALLVKDLTFYSKFNAVFGRIFFGIDFSSSQTEEGEEELETLEEDEESYDKEEENLSQEIVEPGFTEEHHGGQDVHQVIEHSASSTSEGSRNLKQQKEQVDGGDTEGGEAASYSEEGEGKGSESKMGEKERMGSKEKRQEEEGAKGGEEREAGEGERGLGKAGYSARELIIEHRYDQYDKDQILNYEQFGRVLAKLAKIIKENSEEPTDKLNVSATVEAIAKNAGVPKLIWEERREARPKLILMFDIGGSTDEYRPVIEKLFAAARDYLSDVEIYYFHNAIYGYVWPQEDGEYGKHLIPLWKILSKDRDSKVIIVGDAWMAEPELTSDYTDEEGNYFPSGIECFQKMKKNFEHVVWINPIPKKDWEEWDNSGTISEIGSIFEMYEMSLSGLEEAISKLMEE